MTQRPIVLAITGASGAVYALRLLHVLLAAQREVHLAISPSGQAVLLHELGLEFDFTPEPLLGNPLKGPLADDEQWRVAAESAFANRERLTYHHYRNFMSPIASGSHRTAGMVVCPCSGSTLSAVALGASNNLIHRAAEVHLKERRRLILVPRESPLSTVYLNNLRTAAEAGAVILPAMPGWYHQPRGVGDLVDFVVARILDQLDMDGDLVERWGDAEP